MKKGCIALTLTLAAGWFFRIAPAYATKMDRPITAWPLIYYRGDSEHANADVIWPVFRYERKGTWNRLAIRPFIFATQKDTDYRKTNVLWPLSGYEREGKSLSLYIFPLYWYGHNSSYRYNIFFPFYWSGNYGSWNYFHLWPLYGQNKNGNYREYSMVYPFFKYGYQKESTYKNMDLFWPIFNFRKNDQYNSLRLFPVIFVKNDYSQDYRHVNVLLFFSDYQRQGENQSLVIFPFYWQKRWGNYSYTHIWPLFGASRRGTYREYSTIYPFFRYGVDSDDDSVTWHALWPLAKYKQAGDYLYFRFFPLLYFSHKGINKQDFILPFYYRKQNEHFDFSMITPLFLRRETEESRMKLLIPLYYRQQDSKKDIQMVTPFYYSKKTPEQSLKTLAPLYFDYQQKDLGVRVFLPLLFHYRKGPFSFSTFAPVYFHAEDKKTESAFTYFFPFYGIYSRGEAISRHFLLFPLYSRLYDNKLALRAYDVLWPLFHYEESPRGLSVRALPLYIHNRTGQYNFTGVIPFYWHYQGGNTKYLHLLPLFSEIRKGNTYGKKFILGPLYMSSYDTTIQAKSLSILFPLFSYQKEKGTLSSWLLPLFYHRKDATETFTFGSFVLFPPYFYYKENRYKNSYSKNLHLWPFYGRFESGSYKEYSMLWPLFRIGRDDKEQYRKVHLLLYYHEGEKEDYSTTFFPLYKSNKDGLTHYSWLFPIYYHRGDEKREETFGTLCLFPPYLYRLNDGQKKIFHVWPFFGRYQNENYQEYSTLWPLFRIGEDKEHDYRKLNIALYYYRRLQEDTFTAVFPMWWHRNSPEMKSDKTLLLYNYIREGDRKSLRLFWLLFPEVSLVKIDKTPNESRNSFFPLYHYNKDKDETGFHIAYFFTPELSLFGVNHRQDYNKSFLFPLYHYGRYKQDKSFRLGWLFYPGIALFKYDNNGYAKTNTLFPLYSYKHIKGSRERVETASKEFRILWRLVRSYRSANASTLEINPLYYYEQKKGEGSYWAILGGLFGLETAPSGNKKARLFWIF